MVFPNIPLCNMNAFKKKIIKSNIEKIKDVEIENETVFFLTIPNKNVVLLSEQNQC